MNNTAMQDIKSKYEEANSMVNFNIVIPSNKKEIIRAFKGLINTFNKEISKADVNVYKFEKKKEALTKKLKTNFLVSMQELLILKIMQRKNIINIG